MRIKILGSNKVNRISSFFVQPFNKSTLPANSTSVKAKKAETSPYKPQM